MKLIRYLGFFIVVFIVACGVEEKSSVPLYTVSETEFKIQISGFGEIEAAQSQKILSPGRRPMTISWLQDENTLVNKGDVIAKFDAQQILKDSRAEELALLSIEQDILKSNAQQNQAIKDVDSDQTFVRQEFEFVDRFAIDDLRIYSQLEIIDTLANRDFLEAKDEFLDWKENSIVEQHSSQIAVLDIRKSGVESKFQQHQQALSSLEVVSPYSGLLIYEKDRRGEKPAIGQTVFPGRAIAQIPNLDDMQAKLFVKANEAIDLAKKQPVTIVLDAFVNTYFKGTVIDVSGFPRSIERGNPVTYFELTVKLLEQDKNKMQPGRKLRAEIEVQAPLKSLVVPLQALHFENNSSYVYLKDGSEFVKRRVTSGRKNLYVVEIEEGLAVNDLIALATPQASLVRDTL